MNKLFGVLKKYNIFLLLSWIIIILLLSLCKMPHVESLEEIKNFDKLVHFTMYFILSVLGLTSLYTKYENVSLNQVIISLTFFILFGGIIEILQSFVNRTCSFFDFITNAIGVFVGYIIFILALKKPLKLI